MEILLVEDNPADQEIARRVFGADGASCKLLIAEDGQKALDYLKRAQTSRTAKRPQPDLILMDINMPRLSGMETLRRLKRDRALCHIPVLMLTTSSQESDIYEAYRLGCNSYILKPVDVPQFTVILRLLLNYWSWAVTLPARTRGDHVRTALSSRESL